MLQDGSLSLLPLPPIFGQLLVVLKSTLKEGGNEDGCSNKCDEYCRSTRCDGHPLECPFPSIKVEEISSDEETNDNDDESVETPPYELRGFETWLQSADGRKLDHKTSQQHTKQVFKLLHTIDEKHEVLSLFDERLINDMFLEDHAKNTYTPKLPNRT